MNREDYDADIARVEQHLAAGRIRIHDDWDALGAAVTRKTSWAPYVLAAVAAAVLVLSVRRGSSSRTSSRYQPNVPSRPTTPIWAALLTGMTTVARVVTLPQVGALWRALRRKGP